MNFDSEINVLEGRIVKRGAEVDDLRWQQAERVVRMLDAGMSQRAVAAKWINLKTDKPYSHAHVGFVVAAFRGKSTSHGMTRPSFEAAYRQAQVRTEPTNLRTARGAPALARRDQIRQLAQTADSLTAIATEIQMTPNSVRRVMARHQIVLAAHPQSKRGRRALVMLDRVRELAADGCALTQMATKLNTTRSMLRTLVEEHGIDVPGERHTRHLHRIDSNRVAEQIVLDAEGLTEQLDLIDFTRLDVDTLPALIRRAETARDNFTKLFIKRLKERVTYEIQYHAADADHLDPAGLKGEAGASGGHANAAGARGAAAV